jgi:citrate synthase
MSATPATTPLVYAPGLDTVIAGDTAISSIEDGLRYRGYPVGELVEHCTFDEVAFMLLHGELPNTRQLDDFRKRITAARAIPDSLRTLLKSLSPNVPGMDALRTSVSVMAHFDLDAADTSKAANLRKAERLLAQIPIAVADHFRMSKGHSPVAPRPDLSHAANFLYMIRGKEPTAEETRAFDVSLILYAEHEFNASTFACRVVTSTESDLHSAVVAGIGALKGPLHGGANERVMEILHAAGGPDSAEAWLAGALARKEKIMGFGHRVYKAGDVRAGIIRPFTQKAAAAAGFDKWEKTADVIEAGMAREKNLHPNVDWPAGRLYHALGLERTIYTPIFVMARITGWSAHVIEQTEHNRLIRPRAKYSGPAKRSVVPLAKRT